MRWIVLLGVLIGTNLFAAPLKYPVVLVHGASLGGARLVIGPLDYGDYFHELPKYFKDQGIEVGVPNLPTNASIGERAIILQNYLNQHYKGRKVNIIAHSMGGLDARYLVSILKYPEVASITGVATPHRGSPLADWAFHQCETGGVFYWLLHLFGYDLKYRRFLPELRPDHMKKIFNAKVKDVPGIRYYSVVAWGTPWSWALSPMLYFTHYVIKWQKHAMSKEKNDGLVPLSSQAWGTLITRTELDHLAQINHHIMRPSREKESLALYAMIVERLAKDGL